MTPGRVVSRRVVSAPALFGSEVGATPKRFRGSFLPSLSHTVCCCTQGHLGDDETHRIQADDAAEDKGAFCICLPACLPVCSQPVCLPVCLSICLSQLWPTYGVMCKSSGRS